MVVEFDEAVFGTQSIGVLKQLATTRYGFHVIAVDHRIAGRVLPFDQVEAAIAATLEARVTARALRQYIEVLAGQARIEGVDLAGAASPLVQ
jgi:peptidyl-prolyl cis-trans isomerase C